MRFIATMLVAIPLFAQGNYKNLKVLTPADMQAGAMRQFVAALAPPGGCNFCHAAAPAGKDSDDNPKKETARKMIAMVKDLNSKLSMDASKPAVTCYTCHRGKTTPDTAPPAGQPLP
jgi:hypothetical protein